MRVGYHKQPVEAEERAVRDRRFNAGFCVRSAAWHFAAEATKPAELKPGGQ
jgi:hypothetical protein